MRLLPIVIFFSITVNLSCRVLAAEVQPGGALDITISGFARFLTAYGQLDKNPNLTREPGQAFKKLASFDFLNDYRLYLLIRGTHDATGLDYGASVQFNSDTNDINNSRQEWIFLRGNFGELRFGDVETAADNMKIGAYTVAVGTGGIDGQVVFCDQCVVVDYSFARTIATGRDLYNTSAVYFSPTFEGFQLGVSYTPGVTQNDTGDALAVRSQSISDQITAGLSYTALIGSVAVRTSVVSVIGPHDAVHTNGTYGGAAISYGNFSIAGGAGYRQIGNRNSPKDFREGQSFERIFYSAGAQYRWDRYAFSINYGDSKSEYADNPLERGRQSALVFGAEVSLMPGVVLSNEIGYVSGKRIVSNGEPVPQDLHKDNDGWMGVARLALTF